jgi:hypothetical protein
LVSDKNIDYHPLVLGGKKRSSSCTKCVCAWVGARIQEIDALALPLQYIIIFFFSLSLRGSSLEVAVCLLWQRRRMFANLAFFASVAECTLQQQHVKNKERETFSHAVPHIFPQSKLNFFPHT